jgi:hypothetical protein
MLNIGYLPAKRGREKLFRPTRALMTIIAVIFQLALGVKRVEKAPWVSHRFSANQSILFSSSSLGMNIEFMIEHKDYDDTSKLIMKIALRLHFPMLPNCDSQQALAILSMCDRY